MSDTEIIDNKRDSYAGGKKMLSGVRRKISIRLKLGQSYVVNWNTGKSRICKFIKCSDKGYNFLDESTSVVMLKHPLYESKYENHQANEDGLKVWMSERLNVKSLEPALIISGHPDDPIKFLFDYGYFYELTYHKKHCYKHQPPGERMIIVINDDKTLAAKIMVKRLEDEGCIKFV